MDDSTGKKLVIVNSSDRVIEKLLIEQPELARELQNFMEVQIAFARSNPINVEEKKEEIVIQPSPSVVDRVGSFARAGAALTTMGAATFAVAKVAKDVYDSFYDPEKALSKLSEAYQSSEGIFDTLSAGTSLLGQHLKTTAPSFVGASVGNAAGVLSSMTTSAATAFYNENPLVATTGAIVGASKVYSAHHRAINPVLGHVAAATRKIYGSDEEAEAKRREALQYQHEQDLLNISKRKLELENRKLERELKKEELEDLDRRAGDFDKLTALIRAVKEKDSYDRGEIREQFYQYKAGMTGDPTLRDFSLGPNRVTPANEPLRLSYLEDEKNYEPLDIRESNGENMEVDSPSLEEEKEEEEEEEEEDQSERAKRASDRMEIRRLNEIALEFPFEEGDLESGIAIAAFKDINTVMRDRKKKNRNFNITIFRDYGAAVEDFFEKNGYDREDEDHKKLMAALDKVKAELDISLEPRTIRDGASLKEFQKDITKAVPDVYEPPATRSASFLGSLKEYKKYFPSKQGIFDVLKNTVAIFRPLESESAQLLADAAGEFLEAEEPLPDDGSPEVEEVNNAMPPVETVKGYKRNLAEDPEVEKEVALVENQATFHNYERPSSLEKLIEHTGRYHYPRSGMFGKKLMSVLKIQRGNPNYNALRRKLSSIQYTNILRTFVNTRKTISEELASRFIAFFWKNRENARLLTRISKNFIVYGDRKNMTNFILISAIAHFSGKGIEIDSSKINEMLEYLMKVASFFPKDKTYAYVPCYSAVELIVKMLIQREFSLEEHEIARLNHTKWWLNEYTLEETPHSIYVPDEQWKPMQNIS